MTYEVAIIGTGPAPETRDRDGYAMAYRHAPGYERLEQCELVACADIVPENAQAFAQQFDLRAHFDDHREMLEEVDPDIVSICVPPTAHAELVIDCANWGNLLAIHCEKPMATTWGDCRAMVEACDAADVQLTIDHQRRLAEPVSQAKQLIANGEIGGLRRLEWSEVNLFDAGSHLFDLCDHLTDGARPAWALAGVTVDPDNEWFGQPNDTHSIATWGYEDGTVGLASTAEDGIETVVDPYLRIVGEDGVIEIQSPHGPPLRVRTDGAWRAIDTDGESVYGPSASKTTAAANKVLGAIPGVEAHLDGPPTHYERAIAHMVDSLERGGEPVFSGRRVLRGTELIFACYESARQQQRVSLPLDIEDNPLESLLARGESVDAIH